MKQLLKEFGAVGFYVAFFLIAAGTAHCQPSLIAHQTSSSYAPQSPYTCAYAGCTVSMNTSSCTPNCMLAVCLSGYQTATQPFTNGGADSLGNVFTLVNNSTQGGQQISLYTSVSVTGGSTDTLATGSAEVPGGGPAMSFMAFSGIASGPDQTATSPSVGTPFTVGPKTPTNNDELLISCAAVLGTSISSVSPLSLIDNIPYNGGYAGGYATASSYQVQTTATATTATWANVSGGTNVAILSTFYSTQDPAPLTATTSTLPEGFKTVAYNLQLKSSGGVCACTWTQTSGTAISTYGLSLSPGGLITGTPTSAVSAATVTFTVTDSQSNTASTSGLTLTIATTPLSVTSSATAATGTQYASYSGYTATATGGTVGSGYTWSIGPYPSAYLPEGLLLNSSTGAVTGSQIGGQGTYSVQIVVTDSLGATASKYVTFGITGVTGFLANIFPSNSIWHTKLDFADSGLPVDTSPAAAIIPAYQSTALSVNFGSGTCGLGHTPCGYPVYEVPYNQATVPVNTTAYQCYFGTSSSPDMCTSSIQAPIPGNQPLEDTLNSVPGLNGAGCGDCDSHMFLYQEAGGGNPPSIWTMEQGFQNAIPGTAWSDLSNGLYSNVTTNAMILNGTPAAAGTPIMAEIYFPEEVIGTGTPTSPNGTVGHIGRMDFSQVLDYYVWPATTNFVGYGSCLNSMGVQIPRTTQLSQSSPPASCTGPGPSANSGTPFGEIYRLKASIYNAIMAGVNVSGVSVSGGTTSTFSGSFTPSQWIVGTAFAPSACSGGSGFNGAVFVVASVNSTTITATTKFTPTGSASGCTISVSPVCVFTGTCPQAAIIITGLYTYGAMAEDLGSNGALDGTPDTRWNTSDLSNLGGLTLSELEPVNVSSIIVSNNSFQAGTSSGTAPTITSSCPTSPATQGTAYTPFTVTATGSPTPTFGVLSGNLPSGLSLNGATGVISGTPLGSGTSSFTLEAVNGVSPASTQPCTIQIVAVSPTISAAGSISAGHVIPSN